jgi:hypothetical protein
MEHGTWNMEHGTKMTTVDGATKSGIKLSCICKPCGLCMDLQKITLAMLNQVKGTKPSHYKKVLPGAVFEPPTSSTINQQQYP